MALPTLPILPTLAPVPALTLEAARDTLAAAVGGMHAVLGAMSPGSISGDEAKALVDLFAQAERAGASGIALFAPRVAQTGAHAKAGHASAADWLASVCGSSAGVAKGRLAAATRAGTDAALSGALHSGGLSAPELNVLSETEAASPGSAATLLDLAGTGASHQELSDAATRIRAAARSHESERTRRARVHERRHLRWRQCPEGGIRGEFSCDEVHWARVAPHLEAAAKERWKQAGSRDPSTLEAHRLDAFIELLAGAGAWGSSGTGPRVQTLVLIDAEALRRGTTQGAETCEIEGIGPVSIEAATELLGEGALRYVVKEGFDVKTVTRSTRHVATCIDLALLVRDRTCAVPGCAKRLGLERDHVVVDYKDDGPTELDKPNSVQPTLLNRTSFVFFKTVKRRAGLEDLLSERRQLRRGHGSASSLDFKLGRSAQRPQVITRFQGESFVTNLQVDYGLAHQRALLIEICLLNRPKECHEGEPFGRPALQIGEVVAGIVVVRASTDGAIDLQHLDAERLGKDRGGWTDPRIYLGRV